MRHSVSAKCSTGQANFVDEMALQNSGLPDKVTYNRLRPTAQNPILFKGA